MVARSRFKFGARDQLMVISLTAFAYGLYHDVMSKTMRLIKAIGSVLDLSPAFRHEIRVTDPEERLRRPWERTGQALQRAMDRYQREQAAQ